MIRNPASALLAVLCTALLGGVPAISQIKVQDGFKTAPLGKDTLCFFYKYERGDTLIYDVDARDSINVQGEGSILKIRLTRVMLICDSVADGKYWMRQVMTSINERQSTADDNSERTTHPWVNRTFTFVIDSLGKRSYAAMARPDVIGVHPAGAFSPLLVPPLGESCGRQNQSWILADTVKLTENAVPAPVVVQTALWRVLDKVDTLGRMFRQLQHSTTAKGWHKIETDGMAMLTTATMNSFGKLSFDDALNVPYHVYGTIENKFTIELKNGIEREGLQRSSMDAQLLEVRSNNPAREFLLARRRN